MLGSDRCTVAPCGVPALKSASEYLTLAYAGGCPGRFEVGCQIPMRFSKLIAAAGETFTLTPKQPNQPIALIADRSGVGLVLTDIKGPDGKSIGMEGGGITGTPYDVFEFNNEALRSNVNPWPQNVGIINSTNGIDFVFGVGANVLFQGISYGYVMGMEGVNYAQRCGLVSSGEMPLWSALAEWQRTGKCPSDLLRKMENGEKRRRAVASLDG